MATYTTASDDQGAYAKTLTANAVDTVDLSRVVQQVEVIAGSQGDLYVTVDGSTPSVAGGKTIKVPASMARVIPRACQVVKLISSAATSYDVAEAV